MANKTYQPILIQTVEAQEDLTEKTFIGFDGNTCEAGAKAFGIADVSTESGQLAPVGVLGTFLVISGGAITQGSAVTSDASGKAVVATAPSITTEASATTLTAGDEINGYALDAATAAGEEIRVLRGI